jgi:hypothetical protein
MMGLLEDNQIESQGVPVKKFHIEWFCFYTFLKWQKQRDGEWISGGRHNVANL